MTEPREGAGRDETERTQSVEEVREAETQESADTARTPTTAGRVAELRRQTSEAEAEERRSYGVVEIPYNLDDGGLDTRKSHCREVLICSNYAKQLSSGA